MALRDFEGFESQSSLVFNLAGPGAVQTTTTRGYWSRASWNPQGSICRRAIPGTASADLYFGMGFYVTAGNQTLMKWRDSGAAILDDLNLNGGGRLEIRRGGSAILATGTKILSINTWYYIETHLVISDTIGVAVVHVDEVEDINVTGQDTKPGTTTTMDSWETNLGNGNYIDDFYCDDAAFLGDCGVKGLFTTSAGDVTQLTRGGADSGANWSQVDERPPNSDTDYVYSSTVDQYDLYNIENLDTELSVVKGLKLHAFAEKVDAGAASLSLGAKYDSDGNGTADTESWGSDQALSTGYALYERLMEQDPVPSGWTQAEVNALQIGPKVR